MSVIDAIGIIGSFVTIIVFVGWLLVQAVRGTPERDAEDAAREHFSRTGRWPDDERA